MKIKSMKDSYIQRWLLMKLHWTINLALNKLSEQLMQRIYTLVYAKSSKLLAMVLIPTDTKPSWMHMPLKTRPPILLTWWSIFLRNSTRILTSKHLVKLNQDQVYQQQHKITHEYHFWHHDTKLSSYPEFPGNLNPRGYPQNQQEEEMHYLWWKSLCQQLWDSQEPGICLFFHKTKQ